MIEKFFKNVALILLLVASVRRPEKTTTNQYKNKIE
jgi:hypothetical protein